MDMPPSRYRVVERDRRLIVIDNWSGAPVTGLPPKQQARVDRLVKALGPSAELSRPVTAPRRPPPTAAPRSSPPATRGDSQVLTTQPWFDDKAPRSVRIDSTGQSRFGVLLAGIFIALTVAFVWLGWPALVVLGFLFMQKGVRREFRKAMTRWLDGFERA